MNVRNAVEADAAQLLAIYAPYVEQTAITFETEVPSVAEFEKRIVETQEKFPYLVAEEDGEIIGYAYAHPYYGRAAYAWTVESSIYVKMDGRKAGVGTILYDALENALAEQHVVNVLACISLPNEGSIAFHSKRGYQKVAHFDRIGYKFDKWHDIVWLQKRLTTEKTPKPILYKKDQL